MEIPVTITLVLDSDMYDEDLHDQDVVLDLVRSILRGEADAPDEATVMIGKLPRPHPIKVF